MMIYQIPVIVSVVGLSFAAALAISMPLAGAQTYGHGLSKEATAAWRKLYRRPNATELQGRSDKISLGKRLFNDPRLSRNLRRSCASCHRVEAGFSDGNPRALGPKNEMGQRNIPTLWNVRWAKLLNWDGSAKSLEQQAASPISGALELASSIPDVLDRLNKDTSLVTSTRKAFGSTGSIERNQLLGALAAYQRSLVSPRTRFDAWIDGDGTLQSVDERAGFELFVGKGGCAKCHSGWRFTDDKLHDIGLPILEKRKTYKTPTLRELLSTAPYMHDGSKATLEAAVRHYSEGIAERMSLSPNLKLGLELTDVETAHLVAFLKTLSAD